MKFYILFFQFHNSHLVLLYGCSFFAETYYAFHCSQCVHLLTEALLCWLLQHPGQIILTVLSSQCCHMLLDNFHLVWDLLGSWYD